MDAVRGEKAIINALTQAVLVDRITEVLIGISVVLAARRGRHPELVRRFEILQDFAPITFVPGASPVTLIHDNKIEEIRGVFAVESGPAFVASDGLIDGEIHLPALVGHPPRPRFSNARHRKV